MPLVIPLTYFFLLPAPSAFLYHDTLTSAYEDFTSPVAALSAAPYTPLATSEDQDGEEEGALSSGPKRNVALSAADKWRLVKPLLPKYMLPLCKYLLSNRAVDHHLTSILLVVCVYLVCLHLFTISGRHTYLPSPV